MRTTIDMPDDLMKRAKQEAVRRRITFKTLIIDSLERSLRKEKKPFVLRDASVGAPPEKGKGVTVEQINRAIDQFNDPAE